MGLKRKKITMIIIIKELEYTKQVVNSVIAHLLPADALPVPKQHPLAG